MQKYAKREKMEKMRVFYEIEKVENILRKYILILWRKILSAQNVEKNPVVFCTSLKDHLKTQMKV